MPVPFGGREDGEDGGWSDFLRMKAVAQPMDLELLADTCEGLEIERQRWGLAQVLHLLGGSAPGTASANSSAPQVKAMWAGLLADSDAYESAAIALLPARSVYTCGRLGDGGHIAQVVLPGGAGAHSRGANTLGMAIIAALLRALAREAPPNLAAY